MSSLWHVKHKKKTKSLKQAIFWIFLSTLFISGTAAFSLLYYFHIKELRLRDDRYVIRSIYQRSKNKNRLSTSYLAELLDLSSDKKINLVEYKTDQAEKKLLSSPLIKSAKVKKQRPSTLLVEYELRVPSFRLSDFSNTGMDAEGVLFPLEPFYGQEGLLDVYFGEIPEEVFWGEGIPHQKLQSLVTLVEEMKKTSLLNSLEIKLIDLSKEGAKSLGQKEIVLTLVPKFYPETKDVWLLRLRTKELEEQMLCFAELVEALSKRKDLEGSKIIDLRLPQLGFIKK